MTYPTWRANAVNTAPVTIAAHSAKPLQACARGLILASIFGTSSALAEAARASPPALSPSSASDLTPGQARVPALAPTSANLDGVILWLGPAAARTSAPTGADSCVGIELSIVRVRERRALSAAGLTLGAGRYASSDAGRIWAAAVTGTRWPTGWMTGISAGPMLELSPIARPRVGASVGLWIFVGVVPFVRIAALADRGVFAEAGLSIALPVRRW
jgi:hypothetical protein